MLSVTQYYRPPRRVPADHGDEYPSRNRTRDILILFGGLVIITILIYVIGIVLSNLGFYPTALGLQLFAVILVWVTAGVGITVGITYFIMKTFLKREFKKRFERMDQERHARYRQMMGLDEAEDQE